MARLSRRPRVVDVESESGVERNALPVPWNTANMVESHKVNESDQTGSVAASAAALEQYSDSPGADTGNYRWVMGSNPDELKSKENMRQVRKASMASSLDKEKVRAREDFYRVKRKALSGSRLSRDRVNSITKPNHKIAEGSPVDPVSRGPISIHDALSAQKLHGTKSKEEIQQELASLEWLSNWLTKPPVFRDPVNYEADDEEDEDVTIRPIIKWVRPPHPETFQRASKQACQKEIDPDKTYSSADKPPYYDPGDLQSSASSMQSASMIDANITENNLTGIPNNRYLGERVGMVQCWECRCTVPCGFSLTHDPGCRSNKQRKLQEIREENEEKEEKEAEKWVAYALNKPALEMEKEDKPEEEKVEIWTEVGDAEKSTEVLEEMKATEESEKKVIDHATVSRDRAENEFVGDHAQMSFEWGFADTTSAPSSYANSVASIFTTESLTSSASYLSRDSGYSAVQVLTATKELLSIVLEDRVLLPIYKFAIRDPNIGPERLQRDLRRLFGVYANLLEEEATERLEYLASQLVLLKAGFLADSIIEKLRNGPAGCPGTECHDNSSDDDDNGDANVNSDVRPVNEDAFEDLAVFREFLIGSEAFKALRANVQAFVKPKPPRVSLLDATVREKLDVDKTVIKQKLAKPSMRLAAGLTLEKWLEDARNSADLLFRETEVSVIANVFLNLVIDALFLATDEFLITVGLLEPILKRNMTRLRWRCNCGKKLYSDVAELRAGGLDELINHMQRTSGVKVQTAPYNQPSNNQRYVAPYPSQWVKNAVTKIISAFTGPSKSPGGLPQHNPPQSTTACSTTPNTSSQPRVLRLLTCMHRDRFRKVLHQDVMEGVTTDRTLLCFLQKQYLRHRGHFLHMLSLKRIKGIFFVKLRLPIGGSVDVRHHNPCCVAGSTGSITCECIPPPPKVEPSPGAEYVCIPGPPPTYPLIPPEYLASLFTCPTDVHEQDTWILDQLPKRTRDELRGQIGQPAEGWGIYYEEGLDRDLVTLAVLVIFILASVLFGILWSVFRFDVQGAFGVSSYMIACCAVFISFFATRAEKLG